MDLALLESFALATDRQESLRRLVPGTDEHTFLQVLLHQQRGELREARKLLDDQPHAPHRDQLLLRQTLLESAPPGDLATSLGVRFDHRCQLPGKAPPLPTRVAEGWGTRAAVVQRVVERGDGGVESLSQRGLDRLLAQPELSASMRHKALARLNAPRLPDLAEQVQLDLQRKNGPSFGALTIHRHLTLAQHAELAEKLPKLLSSETFVESYRELIALDPDAPRDEESRLDRQLVLLDQLPVAFAPQRAALLYRRIVLRWQRGVVDRDGLRRYLAQTAPTGDRKAPRDWLAASGASEELLLAVLHAALREGADDLRGLLSERWLRQQQAEAMLLSGDAEIERWAAALEPARLRALQTRVDLELAPTNPPLLARDEAVALAVDVKAIESLVVRVFPIDVVSHFRAQGSDVNVDLDLDGFVPSHERVLKLTQPPLHRHRVQVELPELAAPGTYVVDLVGGGLGCRALVRKGALQAVLRVGAAGHVVTVMDEQGAVVTDARLWLGDRCFEPAADGTLLVPFVEHAGTRAVLLQQGDVTSLQSLHLVAEQYELSALFHVEDEDLLPGAEATLRVRARLEIAHGEASLALVEGLKLTVSLLLGGSHTARVYESLEFSSEGEAAVTFDVPEGLRTAIFSLEGQLVDLRGERRTVVARGRKDAAQAGAQIASLLLADEPAGWTVLVLGKNGEAQASRPVEIEVWHELSRESLRVSMQSDEQGRIALGPLPGARRLQASLQGSGSQEWSLERLTCSMPSEVRLQAGQTLRLPVDDADLGDERPAHLFSTVEGRFVRDLSARVQATPGGLEVAGLAAGSYRLELASGPPISVLVTEQAPVRGWTLLDRLALPPVPRPPAVLRAEVQGDALTIEAQGASPSARVHVIATTLTYPAPDLTLSPLESRLPLGIERAPCLYSSARLLGDEARYVLARRHAPRRAGNLLPPPSLLLTPWAVGEASSREEELRAGGRHAAMRGGAAAASAADEADSYASEDLSDSETPPDLSFLACSARSITGLALDADGKVSVPLRELAGHGAVRVVLVDGDTAITRRLAVAPLALPLRDLRMQSALAPDTVYALRGEVTVLAPGQRLALRDALYNVYDSLGKVWALLDTLDQQGQCTRFEFLKQWPSLDDSQKQKHYSDSACHELNYFLYRKDRPFFDRVIAPFLASKRQPTFLDHYLLGHDLSAYLAPSRYARLNALERILLAQRTGGLDDEAIAQRDFVTAQPVDEPRLEQLFKSALQSEGMQGRSLDSSARSIRASSKGKGGGGERIMQSLGPASRQEAPKTASRMRKKASPVDDLQEESEAQEEKKDLGDDLRRRGRARQLYQPLDRTREYAEQNYRGVRLGEMDETTAPLNPFWRDYAAHRGAGPFVSANFVHATDGSAALLLALAVLDLPLDPPPSDLQADADGPVLVAAAPCVVFSERFQPTSGQGPALLLSRHYTLASDPSQPVEGALSAGQPYVCRVVASNPTAQVRQFDLLLAIPHGSLPLDGGRATRRQRVTLDPYAMESVDLSFYFPAPGQFAHHPAQASADGRALGVTPLDRLTVTAEPPRTDPQAWEQLSQAGSDDEVIAALSSRNLHTIDLDLMAWRLRDRAFYDRALATLERRRHFDDTSWSYALRHGDTPRVAEFLRMRGRTPTALAVESRWLPVDPASEGTYEHLDYTPLVNPRAHGPAGARRILNDKLAAQVTRLLVYLCSRSSLADDDRLALVYYLVLQDRIDEALALFAQVDASKLPGRLIHDYVQAYLAFFQDPARARALATPYLDHPVDRWRDRFREVIAQLDEIEGRAALATDPSDRDQRQAQLAAQEPSLELRASDEGLRLLHRHAPGCVLHAYEMDLELLFSQRPFGLQSFRQRPPLRATHTVALETPPGEGSLLLTLPEALRGKPALIEVTCGEVRAAAAHTAGHLSVQMQEAYGQLRVVHATTGAPLARVYVKVYAQDSSGQESFHKDGYTDLRGRFDYASVSTARAPAARFALLVLSDEHGAALREANAPTR